MKAIPHVKVRFSGALVRPALALRLNGEVNTLTPRPSCPDDSIGPDTDDAGLNDDGDLLDEVNRFLDKDLATEQDSEDGPDWLFEAGEKKSADPTYGFCPAPHRR